MGSERQNCGNVLVRAYHHHAASGPVYAAQIEDVIVLFTIEHLFIVPEAVFSSRRPQKVGNILNGEILLLKDTVHIDH